MIAFLKIATFSTSFNLFNNPILSKNFREVDEAVVSPITLKRLCFSMKEVSILLVNIGLSSFASSNELFLFVVEED